MIAIIKKRPQNIAAAILRSIHGYANMTDREQMAWMTTVDIEDARILPLIQAIADENNSLFGYQNMTYALNNNSDVKYNRKRIYRIMAV